MTWREFTDGTIIGSITALGVFTAFGLASVFGLLIFCSALHDFHTTVKAKNKDGDKK